MRKFLLDTQIALWLFADDRKLDKERLKKLSLAADTRFIFHQVSTWEIQIKYDLGKLPLVKHPQEFLKDTVSKSGLDYEPISDAGIFFLSKLPAVHKDPFDRLLLAHAIINGWIIISADDVFNEYPVQLERF